MRTTGPTGRRPGRLLAAALAIGLAAGTGQAAQEPPAVVAATTGEALPPGEVRPIDLNTALRLANVQNPELQVARSRVVEAAAIRQYAAAQILPSLNPGFNYDIHTGNLQQSNGNILAVNRAALYVGAGSNAIAAGTVNIPGVSLAGNAAAGLYLYLGARQEVRQREFTSEAVRNQVFLRVAIAYCELSRAEARYAIAVKVREAAEELARITSVYATTGEGRAADADRAATYLARRRADVRRAEGDVSEASSRLCALLNLDPSIRLHPTDAWVVPHPIVPEPMPLPELIALALLRRPELSAQRAAVQQALLAVAGARALPFSPNFLIGFSAGSFGGGSNLVNPTFGSFASRSDFDVVAFWTLQNLGLGNVALVRTARARADVSRFQELEVLDRVRDEVASAYARSHARYAQIGELEAAVRSGREGFRLDLERIRQAVPAETSSSVRPIEVLDSLRLLAESMTDYLDAIVDYNQAEFALYVALGQPPADALAHPVAPAPGGPPPTSEPDVPGDAAPLPPIPGTPAPFAPDPGTR